MSDSNSILAAELQETRAKLAASEAKVKEFEAAVQQKPLLRKWIEAGSGSYGAGGFIEHIVVRMSL